VVPSTMHVSKILKVHSTLGSIYCHNKAHHWKSYFCHRVVFLDDISLTSLSKSWKTQPWRWHHFGSWKVRVDNHAWDTWQTHYVWNHVRKILPSGPAWLVITQWETLDSVVIRENNDSRWWQMVKLWPNNLFFA